MEKNGESKGNLRSAQKIFRRMKILAFFMLVWLIQVKGEVYSQNQLVTLQLKNCNVEEFLQEVKNQTGIRFMYRSEFVRDIPRFSLDVRQERLDEVLEQVFAAQGIHCRFEDEVVILMKDQAENKMREIRGTVRDAGGNALPGVTVLIKGTSLGTATDADGKYALKLPEGEHILIFTMVGMEIREEPVGKRTEIDVVLKEDVTEMDEVIVTGYQTITKERATGAYSKLSGEKLANQPVVNLNEALDGLIPGVTAQGNGHFLIRGIGTFQEQTDRDPLVIVDGFPVQAFGLSDINPFSSINPNDVESITVLKDAAATSIYGARAANGVIVVTTKKGRQGNSDKVNVDVNAFVSVAAKPDLKHAFNMADTETTLAYLKNLHAYNQSVIQTWVDPYYSSSDPFKYMSKLSELYFECYMKNNITETKFNEEYQKLLANEGKWEKEYNKYFFRRAINQQYHVSLNGRSNKNRYYLSVSYDRGLPMSIGDESNRFVLNINNDFQILKKLTLSLGVNARISHDKGDGVSISTLKSITSPYTTLFNEDGSYAHIATSSTVYEPILESRFGDKLATSWNYNPLEDRSYNHNTTKNFNTRFQAGIDYKIIDGLNFSIKGQYERNQYDSRAERDPESFTIRTYTNKYSTYNEKTGKYETNFPAGGTFTTNGSLFTSYNLRGQIDFNRVIAEDHSVSAMLGGEITSSKDEKQPTYTRYGYNKNTNAVDVNPNYYEKTENIFGNQVYWPYASLGMLSTLVDRFLSAYLNVSYTYKEIYSLTASARADASNYVSDEVKDKFSPFWSVGASWNLGRENFLKDTEWINNLKLRLSYGVAGVAAGKGSVSTLTTLSTYGGNVIYSNNEPYSVIYYRGNPTLTWEKSRSLNVGVDFNLFRNKLYGTLDVYRRYSYDVLSKATVPYIAQSVTSATYNNAEISNKGIELTLGSSLNITPELIWEGDLNFAYNKNRVEEYHVTPTYPGGSYVVGRPLGCIYAFNVTGYTPEGLLVMKGKDGQEEIVKDRASTHYYDYLDKEKGEITPDDGNWKYYYGTTIAPYNAGFRTSFRAFGITLSAQFKGSFGHKFNNSSAYTLSNSFTASSQNGALAEIMNEDYSGKFKYMPHYTAENADNYNSGFLYGYMTNLVNSSMSMYKNAGHIRCDKIYLGYDLPQHWISRDGKGLKRVQAYMQLSNLGIVWSASGIDPLYPKGSAKPTLTWLFGVKINL